MITERMKKMREILFRGKEDSGKWFFGNLFVPDIKGRPTQICMGTSLIRIARDVIPETVGQYTGLKDKNGKKIFEGDIVLYARDEEVGQIAYHETEAMFIVEFDTWLTDFDHTFGDELEVIGNIHDNPELMKGSAE